MEGGGGAEKKEWSRPAQTKKKNAKAENEASF